MASNLQADALFDVTGRSIAITGAGRACYSSQVNGNGDLLTSTHLASGIGRMLARGFAVNGAHTILIDINEQSLKDVKSELEELTSSNAGFVTIQMYMPLSKAPRMCVCVACC
jgi:NAD(P)-dependent dehydrogenase (short-subunit alcohol dehydrogenase family)